MSLARWSLLSVLTAGFVTAAARDEEEIPFAKLPEAVRKAAEGAVPRVKWESGTKDVEDGKTVYTVDGENAKGKAVSVEVTADGKVLEVSVEVVMAEVPAVVKDALKKKLPRFKIDDIFEVSRGGKVVEYQFEGQRPKDKKADHEITVTVSADGKTVEIDED